MLARFGGFTTFFWPFPPEKSTSPRFCSTPFPTRRVGVAGEGARVRMLQNRTQRWYICAFTSGVRSWRAFLIHSSTASACCGRASRVADVRKGKPNVTRRTVDVTRGDGGSAQKEILLPSGTFSPHAYRQRGSVYHPLLLLLMLVVAFEG